jgi:hypothetical protein
MDVSKRTKKNEYSIGREVINEDASNDQKHDMQECVHAIHQVEEYSIRPGAS